jgi:O-antigen chain-terminating methyltransferase
MLESNRSDLDVERIMHDIREAVASRGSGPQTNGSSPPVPVSSVNYTPPNGDALHLQPPFQPKLDNHYHVNDLLRFHGADFLRTAYVALLSREPDESGLARHWEGLASGRFNKLDVLGSLRSSPEGRRNNVKVDGLWLPVTVRRVGRLPIIGYIVRLMIAVARLPRMLQSQNQYEFYLWAQLQRIVEYQNQHKRQTTEALAQMSAQISAQLLEVTQRSTEQQQTLTTVSQQLEALAARQAEFGTAIDTRLSEIENEIELLKAEKNPPLRDSLYALFEDCFRGESEEVQRRLEVYLPVVAEAQITNGVLDLGCGRGEWLRLLGSKGITCQGVDSNRTFIDRCRRAGLDVVETDALAHLQGLPPASLNMVTSFHLVEHLPFRVLVNLLEEIERTLKPGGVVILETPNPENVMVGSCTFYTDPSHRNPIPSQTLEFLLESHGFSDIRIWKLRPWEAAKLPEDSELVRRFNEYFYSAPDYGIIAKKP